MKAMAETWGWQLVIDSLFNFNYLNLNNWKLTQHRE